MMLSAGKVEGSKLAAGDDCVSLEPQKEDEEGVDVECSSFSRRTGIVVGAHLRSRRF